MKSQSNVNTEDSFAVGVKKNDCLDISKILCKVQKNTLKPFSFTIKLLNLAQGFNEVKDSLELQDAITKNLVKTNSEGFITQKTAEDFIKLRDYKNGITVGIFDSQNGKLVGQSSISFQNLKDINCSSDNSQKISYSPQCLEFTNVKKIFEVKGTMVHPNYNGMNLSKDMASFLEYSFCSLFNDSDVVLMSEIATNNSINLYVSQSCGFKPLQKYVAFDGVECYLLYKPMNSVLSISTGFDKAKPLIDVLQKSNELVK